jgi:hypothetical protein
MSDSNEAEALIAELNTVIALLVREMRQLTQRLATSKKIPLEPPTGVLRDADNPLSFRSLAEEVRELEVYRIKQALQATGGNQERAAILLYIPRRTFTNKVKLYGLTPRQPVAAHHMTIGIGSTTGASVGTCPPSPASPLPEAKRDSVVELQGDLDHEYSARDE